tara:strand:+ start:66 stop:1184 length:1119 start_codon:yes stop_codon:yes gene_type:complete
MSTHDLQTITSVLDSLGKAIHNLADTTPAPIEIADRSISGNKISGGLINRFSSNGISDQATRLQLLVTDAGITANTIEVDSIVGDTSVTGSLTVNGAITATSLHVNELTADVRNERTSSLEFVASDTNTIIGKGLIWRAADYSKQFVFHENPDRVYSTEHIDLGRSKAYHIEGVPVLSAGSLGIDVVRSSLTTVGTLEGLSINGNVVIDNYIFWESTSNRLGLGTEDPKGSLSIAGLDSEFIIDTEGSSIRLGSWTNNDVSIVTDDTERLTVKANGVVEIGQAANNNSKLNVYGQIGVGVKNIETGVSISTSGPVKFEGKKFEVGSDAPTGGTYAVGDIVWNSNPRPTGYVGWICVRAGTPGEWKTFGQINK